MTDYPRDKVKLSDWRGLNLESDWNEARMKYTDSYTTFQHTTLPLFHVDELVIEPEDYIPLNDTYDKCKGNEYAYGYNEKMGDTGDSISFKCKICIYLDAD